MAQSLRFTPDWSVFMWKKDESGLICDWVIIATTVSGSKLAMSRYFIEAGTPLGYMPSDDTRGGRWLNAGPSVIDDPWLYEPLKDQEALLFQYMQTASRFEW